MIISQLAAATCPALISAQLFASHNGRLHAAISNVAKLAMLSKDSNICETTGQTKLRCCTIWYYAIMVRLHVQYTTLTPDPAVTLCDIECC